VRTGFKDSDDNDVEDGNAIKYVLGVKSAGVDSGLDDTLSGDNILLRYNATDQVVEGYLANATATLAFTVGVDADSGAVTLTQLRAVEHNDSADPQEIGASAATLAAADLITLTATITDGDGDTDQATAEIGRAFAFLDDGPFVTMDDALGTYAAGADGDWTPDPGEDGFKSLGVSFDSFKIGSLASQTTTAANSTFEKTGDYTFAGSITGDFTDDGVANSQTVKFTLTFDPDTKIYDLSVTEVPTSVIVRDSSQGALKSSGPNPVRTLLFGGSEAGADDVLFFGVVATAPAERVEAGDPPIPNDLEDLIVVGATDLDEGQIRSYLSPTNRIPTLINSSTQMNVSTRASASTTTTPTAREPVSKRGTRASCAIPKRWSTASGSTSTIPSGDTTRRPRTSTTASSTRTAVFRVRWR
jgi:hypothetical protein